jgi:hypothetical protein
MKFLSRTSVLLMIAALVTESLVYAVDLWTVGVNNTRQGWNRFETVLTPANVPRLKKLREFPVDEKIDVLAPRRRRQALCLHR